MNVLEGEGTPGFDVPYIVYRISFQWLGKIFSKDVEAKSENQRGWAINRAITSILRKHRVDQRTFYRHIADIRRGTVKVIDLEFADGSPKPDNPIPYPGTNGVRSLVRKLA